MRPDAVAKGLYNIAFVAERWLCGEAYWLARPQNSLLQQRVVRERRESGGGESN